MIRRRPIPRFSPKPEHSLRYELIQPGVIRYPDGREVCLDTREGWREYKRRVEIMWRRQNFRCCLCGKRLALQDATFEHQRRRGMGAAWRDDRVEGNGVSHWICNGERG
jgi:hypothetical protein